MEKGVLKIFYRFLDNFLREKLVIKYKSTIKKYKLCKKLKRNYIR